MVYYHPQWKKVKKLISDGEIGDLKHVQGCFTYFNINLGIIGNALHDKCFY